MANFSKTAEYQYCLDRNRNRSRSRKRNQNFSKGRTGTEPKLQQIIMVTQHCILDYDKIYTYVISSSVSRPWTA